MSANDAHKLVTEFARKNKKAMTFLHQGIVDYAAARCCLLNGMLPGLVLAEQAVEKNLKALALFLDPFYSKRRGHELLKLADDIQEIAPHWPLKKERPFLENLQHFYEARYPDDRNIGSQSTLALVPLDFLMVDLAEKMPIPNDVKYRSGLFATVTISLERSIVFPDELWLRKNNVPLANAWPKIERNYREVMARLYDA